MEEFLTTKEAAEFLKHSEQTLERWRQEGKPPKWYRPSDKVLYSKSDLIDWVKSSTLETK